MQCHGPPRGEQVTRPPRWPSRRSLFYRSARGGGTKPLRGGRACRPCQRPPAGSCTSSSGYPARCCSRAVERGGRERPQKSVSSPPEISDHAKCRSERTHSGVSSPIPDNVAVASETGEVCRKGRRPVSGSDVTRGSPVLKLTPAGAEASWDEQKEKRCVGQLHVDPSARKERQARGLGAGEPECSVAAWSPAPAACREEEHAPAPTTAKMGSAAGSYHVCQRLQRPGEEEDAARSINRGRGGRGGCGVARWQDTVSARPCGTAVAPEYRRRTSSWQPGQPGSRRGGARRGRWHGDRHGQRRT